MEVDMSRSTWLLALGAALAGCHPADTASPESTTLLPSVDAWGPETPQFNLEAILRNDAGGFGHVKFRQPNDAQLIVYLDTWIRGLAPNTSYELQRAVDTNVDDDCTSASWLTLGKGAVAQAILTDASGTGREELFRSVAAFPVGSTFDIHFRVIEAGSGAVALTSECYQFTISQ
jgi:hypothetical protein